MRASSPVPPAQRKVLNEARCADGQAGSRRLRLWELPSETHCSIVGVCLPLAALRRLICKALGTALPASDYEFHVAAVAECARRRPISELLQRELDRRYAGTIRRFAQAKSTPALAVLWEQAVRDNDAADALWATLTHPRCDEALRQAVCRDIHMFQHQAGASARADLQRLAALQQEKAALGDELKMLRERHAQDLRQRAVELADLTAQLAQARGRLLARESECAQLRAQLATLEQNVPMLPARVELEQQVERQQAQIRQLERERAHWQQHARQIEARARALNEQAELWRARAGHDDAQQPAGTDLRDKAVLCVGGRTATVPVYRRLIETSGARFLHHDGGEEDNAAQLDASLAAADLVICQTGCISHGAYWRVKDYCKRSGKQCVFVDKPSASSLARCLRHLDGEAALQDISEREQS